MPKAHETTYPPKHIADAIRLGKVTEDDARPYPRLLALVREFKAKGRIKIRRMPIAKRKPIPLRPDRLHPSIKGQRFQPHDSTRRGVVIEWDSSRVRYFYDDDVNTALTISREKFTPEFAHWLPGIQVWPKPVPRVLGAPVKIPAALVPDAEGQVAA